MHIKYTHIQTHMHIHTNSHLYTYIKVHTCIDGHTYTTPTLPLLVFPCVRNRHSEDNTITEDSFPLQHLYTVPDRHGRTLFFK